MRGALLVAPGALAAACAEPPAAPACGDPIDYRIDHLDLPEHQDSWPTLGVDLDGDGMIDDAFGSVLSSIQVSNPDIPSTSALATARLAGDVTWEVVVSSCDDGTRRVVLGNSGGGDTVPVTIFADPSGAWTPVVWSRADGLVAQVAQADDVFDAVIGFGLPMPDDGIPLVTPFAAYLTRELAAGMSPFAAMVDADHDGVVTPPELLSYGLIETLLEPDVTIDGAPCLSAGMHVHATRVP